MKTQEILLASTLLAVVAGVGASLATRAFQDAPARSDPEARGSTAADATTEPGAPAAGTARALDELRMENAALRERLSALEARIGEVASTRTPLAEPRPDASPAELDRAELEQRLAATSGIAFDDAFVSSVGKALDEIEAKEEAEREQRRKELQAERIERRVSELQAELGLNQRQASDLRTVLIAADDKRAKLFDELRELEDDPRGARDGFRVLRDETHESLKGILTADQFEAYRASEESEYMRRDFGPPGGRRGEDRERPSRR